MSLTLKVRIGDATKSMRFAETMSCHEVCKNIQEKIGGEGGGADHAIYKPVTEESGPKGGKWFRPEKTLEYYDLKNGDLIEYRKKHDIVKIKLVDGTIKSMMVDLSLSVTDCVAVIGNKMSLKNCEEYSLLIEGKEGPTGMVKQARIDIIQTGYKRINRC